MLAGTWRWLQLVHVINFAGRLSDVRAVIPDIPPPLYKVLWVAGGGGGGGGPPAKGSWNPSLSCVGINHACPLLFQFFFLHFVKAASSRVNPSELEKCFITLTGLHFLFPDVDIIQEGSLKL